MQKILTFLLALLVMKGAHAGIIDYGPLYLGMDKEDVHQLPSKYQVGELEAVYAAGQPGLASHRKIIEEWADHHSFDRYFPKAKSNLYARPFYSFSTLAVREGCQNKADQCFVYLITFNNGGKAMAIKRWQRITQNISSDEVLEYINKKYGATRPSKKFLLSAKRHKLVSNSIAKTGFERIFSELIPGLRSFDQPPFQNKIPQDRSVKSTQRASLAKTISGYAKKYGEMIYFDIGTESGSKRVSHLATMSFDLGLLVEHLDNTSISAEIEGKKLTKSMEKYIAQFNQDYPPNYRLMLTNPVGLTYPQIEVKYPHVNIDPNVASNDMELYDPSSVFLKDNGESVSNGWIEIKQSNSRYIPLEVDIRETYRVLNPDYDWEALFSKPASEILKTNNSNMYLVNDVNFTYFTNYHLSYLNLIKVLKQDYEISNAKFLFNQKKTKIYIDLTGQYQSFEAIKKDADKTEDLYTNYLNSDLIKCEEISYLGKKVCVDNRQLDLPEHLDYMYIDGKFTLAFNKDTLIKRMKRRTFSGAIYKAGLKQAQDNLEYLKNIGNIDIENSEVRL